MHIQLRAFIRLGDDIDFSNRNHNLMKEVKKRLGPPLITTSYNEIRNTKFCPRNLKRNENIIGRHNNVLKTKLSLIDVEPLFPNGIIGNEFQNGNDIRPENERNAMNLDSRKQNITRKVTCDVANLIDKECELK